MAAWSRLSKHSRLYLLLGVLSICTGLICWAWGNSRYAIWSSVVAAVMMFLVAFKYRKG